MRLCSIASGSSGNCIYIGSEEHHILIDAGISGKRVEAGLNSLELTGKDLDGILLTHEHSDHIKGLGVLSRKYGVPIYTTPGTAEAVKDMTNLGKIDGSLFHEIHADEDFTLGDLTISPFRISHDAAEPVAYRVACGDKKMAVATDLGVYTDYTIDHLKDLDVLLLEANHDIHMLQVGSYPYYLKQRILGLQGHLCNEDAAQFAVTLAENGASDIVLAHLSRDNNTPTMALNAVAAALDGAGLAPELSVAPRDTVGPCHIVRRRALCKR